MELNDARLDNQTEGPIELFLFSHTQVIVTKGNTSRELEGSLLTIEMTFGADRFSADTSKFPITLWRAESPYTLSAWRDHKGKFTTLGFVSKNGKHVAEVPLVKVSD